MKNKNYLIIAAVLGAIAVILGAFGAHSLKTRITAEQLAVYQTGVQYHFYHTFAIALAVIASQFIDNQWIARSFAFFILGILIFSGSLYLMTFIKTLDTEGGKWLGAITPIGGLFFILGWLSFAFGISKSK
jgi:uncharacterized membrane protein YgdD (TMEM256/DUF423 family)